MIHILLKIPNKIAMFVKRLYYRMTNNNTQFIEVRKVVAKKGSPENTKSFPQLINVAEIQTGRAWKKSKNDTSISGYMTMLVLRKREFTVTGSGEVIDIPAPKHHTMLIEENYEDFKYRLSQKAVVKDLGKEMYELKK